MLFSASSSNTLQMNDKQKKRGGGGLVTNDEYLALEEEHWCRQFRRNEKQMKRGSYAGILPHPVLSKYNGMHVPCSTFLFAVL